MRYHFHQLKVLMEIGCLSGPVNPHTHTQTDVHTPTYTYAHTHSLTTDFLYWLGSQTDWTTSGHKQKQALQAGVPVGDLSSRTASISPLGKQPPRLYGRSEGELLCRSELVLDTQSTIHNMDLEELVSLVGLMTTVYRNTISRIYLYLYIFIPISMYRNINS